MPELPEVETTRRGIIPYVADQLIKQIILRHKTLRWKIPEEIVNLLPGKRVLSVERRAKYLLFKMKAGTLILHLGMSGSLRVLTENIAPGKHDHVDIVMANKVILRYTDPRRFGALLWTQDDINKHPLFEHLGVEPLSKLLTSAYLFSQARRRKIAVKSFIMDNKVLVGVGNIYATEALFSAGIKPQKAANEISKAQWNTLIQEIQRILKAAIKKGGTTLKDFTRSDGKPGYFVQQLQVYGRAKKPCIQCGKLLAHARIGQRNTVFCLNCQE